MTKRGNIIITKVSQLINLENREWDEQLIRDIFWPVDAQRILNIPLALSMMEDFVSWNYNRTGIFTVKTAYHMEWDQQHGRKLWRTNSMISASTSPIWSILWKLRVPAKVKIHYWRALYGAIPCRGIMANRHMITNSLYPICGPDCESISHAFFKCQHVQAIWSALGMANMINEL